MKLNSHSKVKDLWNHPLGHDILLQLLKKKGLGTRWLESPLVLGLPITVLDRYAWAGFSRLVLDLCAHEAAPPAPADTEATVWWKEAVIYQIFLPSFMDSDHDGVGDFGGVRQRLPYLALLGVEVLLLRPVLPQSPGSGPVDHYTAGSDWGGTDEFEALATAAHAQGLRLILSMDIGGVSEEHPWFTSALQGGAEQAYFVLRSGGAECPPSSCEMAPGLRAWKHYPTMGRWALRWGGLQRMVLDWESQPLREEISKMLHFWLEKGADGFCFGMAGRTSPGQNDQDTLARWVLGHTGTESPAPPLRPHLKEIAARLPAGTLLLGETSGLSLTASHRLAYENPIGLHILLDASHLVPPFRPFGDTTDLSLQDLRRYYLYWMEHGNAWMGLFLEDANSPRLLGRLSANPLFRSILAKLLGTWLFTQQGTPLLYQGQELGLSNTRFSSAKELHDLDTLHQYAQLCSTGGLSEQAALQQVLCHSADHARTPIPWSAGPGGGFTGAVPWMRLPDGAEHLNVACQTADPCSVWRHYQQLISLRRQHPCLVYGSANPVFTKNNKIMCYFRILGGQKCYVELNLTERQVPRPGRILPTQKLLLSNYDTPTHALRPYEANLYLCENN